MKTNEEQPLERLVFMCRQKGKGVLPDGSLIPYLSFAIVVIFEEDFQIVLKFYNYYYYHY